jgi:hypothetical protein
MGILQRTLGVTREALQSIFTALANLTFCLVMLYGFVRLPADVMLIVGTVTLFIGPALVLWFASIVSELGYFAMWAPMLFVATLLLLLLFKSSAVQWLGLKLGLDVNEDGRVDWRDVVVALQRSRGYIEAKEWLQRQLVGRGFVRGGRCDAGLASCSDSAMTAARLPCCWCVTAVLQICCAEKRRCRVGTASVQLCAHVS